MTKFIIDACAWIEYLDGSEKGKAAANIIEDNSNEIFTSAATVAEIVSKALRSNKETKVAITHINNLSIVVELSQEICIAAGAIHFDAKKKDRDFGMLDAFVAATAKKLNAKILTSDSDFKQFKEAVFI